MEEARTLIEAVPEVDRDSLLAERAEAEAQLRAAEATLGIPPPASNGESDGEQEPKEPAQKPHDVDVKQEGNGLLDVEALRWAATVARAADDALARAASEAAERPPVSEAGPEPGPDALGGAESAFARALQIREELPALWRRLVGALISATGMAIVVGALGWNVYWLLVPIALIAIMTVDLRLAGRAARRASAAAAGELTVVGEAGPEGLDGIRSGRVKVDEAERRLAAARADRDAAYARFEELAPGRLPSEVEEIVAEYEAGAAPREAEAARSEADPVELAEVEAPDLVDAEAPDLAETDAGELAEVEAPDLVDAEAPDLAEAEAAELADAEAAELADAEAAELADAQRCSRWRPKQQPVSSRTQPNWSSRKQQTWPKPKPKRRNRPKP